MIKGQVSFTSFFTALLAIMFAAFGVGQVNADFNSKYAGLAAAQRIFNLIDEPLDSDDPFSTVGDKPASLIGSITFHDVSFSYPTRPNHPIYYPSQGRDGFSLYVPSKESVAFVGRYAVGFLLELIVFYFLIGWVLINMRVSRKSPKLADLGDPDLGLGDAHKM